MKNTLSARSARLAVLAVSFLASALPALAQPSLSFTNITKNATNNGLKSNNVFGVYAIGSTIYAATVNDGPDDNGALSISTNGGTSWTNYNSANGLGGNDVNDVYAIGSTIYAATVGYDSNTPGGVSISINGGGTWTNYTTDNGLGNNITYGVYASGSTVYAATYGGVSISTDGGGNWNNYTTGLLSNRVGGVYASGGTIYAATYSYQPGDNDGGVSISTNGGTSWTNYTTTNGLGSNNVFDVYARGSTIYAATLFGGVSISNNGGGNWTNYTTEHGLGSNIVFGIYATDSAIYAATDGGLSISDDGGANWTNYTTADGLGSDSVRGVYASGGNIYAATTGGLSISFSTIPTLYWLGSNGTLWSAGNNWSSNATGTPTANFASGADIIFSATGSTNSTATDLNGDRSIASLTINSANPVGISGGNLTVSGATTINNGTLTIGNGGTTGALIGDITNNATLAFNRSNDSTYSGSISGSGNLTKLGSGNLTLTGNNTIGGDTTISAGALAITSGAKLNSINGFIGAGNGSGSNSTSNNSSVLVTGSNSTWEIQPAGNLSDGVLYIGGSEFGSGSGNSLAISNGGQVVSRDLYTNFDSQGVSSNNTITVNGTNSLLQVENNMFLGEGWDGGSLTISNGGRVESSYTLVGVKGGNLTATVTGANSTWAIGGQGAVAFVIGDKASSDNNIVKVLNGGNITVSGSGEGASVQVGAEGANNLLEISGANSIFYSYPVLYLGGQFNSSSNNTIEVKNGGTFMAQGGLIGKNAGSSYNSVLVTGANSTWTSMGIEVGGEGTFNSMNVTAGASVTTMQTLVGADGMGSDNTLTISGNGSSLTAQYYFSVGAGGGDRNQVIVQDGALLSVMSGSAVGQSTGAQDNSVLVTGAGSQWQNAGNLDIGLDNGGSPYVGTGQVTVENGGSVTVNGTTTVTYTGSKLGGNGNFTSLGGTTISGGAAFAPTGTSALNVTGDLTFSNGGNYLWNLFANSANASNAGTDFSAASTLSGGNLSVSSSNFTVNMGGTVDSTDNFWKQGHVWTVMTGSAFNLAAGENFTLALSGNSTGFTPDYFSLRSTETALELVYIAPYIWNTGIDNWDIGSNWDSNLVPDATTLAFIDNGGTSQLATTGNVSTLYVGKSNSGSGLEVNAGGNLTVATALIIGDAAASDNNSATVNGTGATLTSPTITVGNFGSNNSLTVSNGGDVSTTSTIYLGTQSGSSDNTITVTGADSQLSGDIVVGANSGSGDVDSDNNKIVVSSGGSVTSSSLALGSSASSANNSLTVNGSGSTYTTTGDITVGGSGDGNSLSVTNAGALSTQNLVLGNTAASANNTATVSGAGSTITATGNITVGDAGGGTLGILNGGNLSAGAIQIASQSGSTGTVNIGAFGGSDTTATLSTPNIQFGTGTAVLNLNLAGNFTLSANLTGGGANSTVNQRGTGTTTLTADNTYNGGITISAGTLSIGNGGTSGSVTAGVTNNSALVFNRSNDSTYSGSISGSGNVTKLGSGNLALTGNNTHTGGTTISAGTLSIGNGSTSGSLTGDIANNSALVFNRSNNSTYSGSISGTGNVTKLGNGTVTLGGTNNYSGGTTVGAGTLAGTTSSLQGAITNDAVVNFDQSTNGTYAGAMSGSGSLVKTGTGTVTLSGANNYSGGTTVSAGTLAGTTTSLQGAIANNAAVNFDQSANGTYAGVMSGSGSLVKSGTGTVTLSGANNYSGGTTVSAGTLAGTTTSLQGAITNNAAVNFDQSTNGTYAGVMSGSGSLVKTGTGTVTLSGANNYSGGTTVSAGTLAGTTTSLQGAIANNAVVNFDQSTNGTYAGVMSGSGSLVKTGTGTVTLTGANNYTGGTTLSAGTLSIGDGGTSGSLTGDIANNAALVFNRSNDSAYSGNITGTGTLEKLGAGVTTLANSTNTVGAATINGGGLTLSNSTVNANSGTITVGDLGNNNTLSVISGGAVSTQNLILGNTATAANNTATVSGAGSTITASGNITVGAEGSANSLLVTNGGALGTQNLVLGEVSGSANNNATVSGAGSTITATGTITVGDGGSANTLLVTNGGALGTQNLVLGEVSGSANNTVTVNGSGSTFAATGNITVGKAGSGTLEILNGGNLSAGAIQIASQSGSTGTVNIGTFGGNTTGGTLSASTINFGGGNGTVNFNQGDNFTFAGNFTGGANASNFYIKQLGSGTTTLTGTGSSAFADVIAEAGRLVFDGAVFDTVGKVFYIGETQSGATVELKNDAIVTAQETYIGYGENAADNTVLVGSNSTLKGNDDSSQLWVGYWNGLNNSLVISGGGRVEYGETYITDRASKVKVSGAGSTLTGAGGQGSEIYLGAFSGANNTLDVENGGSVISTNTILADRVASNNNTITVNGTGSTYTASGTITVGDLGDNNTLSVINSGAVSTQNLILGNTATAANNTATVSGAGSTITASGNITVGAEGSANSLLVTNGGAFGTQNLVLGEVSGSANNNATVSGAGSTINATGTITVGDGGSANSLLVTNSGALGTQNLVLGEVSGSANNTVTVHGSGSTFAATGNITVGKAGSGTLEILNGGNLSAGAIQIASQTGSKGVVNIGTFGGNTTGGTLSAATINFGGGNGTVNFNQGDNFTYAGNFTGGANVYPNNSKIQQLGSGTTTLTGTGSDAYAAVIAEAGRLVFDGAVFDIERDMTSGLTQSGATIELKNNAIVTVLEAYIGYGQNGANNTILVGSNSTLRGNDESSALYVGNWNGLNNSLVISSGGRVEYGETWIADRASKVKVSGAGSTLTGAEGQGSEIYLGAFSGANNTLDVENGGSVISTNTILADRVASNNNTITVNGTGSTYTASGTITVGDLGDNNTLSVITGGAVSTQNLILGNNATAANNTATVSGAGSAITATGNITVGKAGSGTLEILNGGNLSAGAIQIASQSGSTGTVNIGAFGGNTTGGTLSASNIAFGNGTGALNFNQSGSVTIAANLTGGAANSTVNQLGSGTTLLNGNSTYTGEVNIDAGTLATNSGNALGLADVSLNNGTFDLRSGLTIGSFVWNSSGILALDDVDQAQNNFLTVNGSFTLAGSIGNGSHLFDLRNFTLGVDPSKLIAFEEGITESDLNRFGIQNLSNYKFLIQNDALWVKLAALIVNGTTTIEQGSNLTYPLALFDPNSKLVIPGGSPSTTLNFAGNLTVTNNSTVMADGSLAITNPYVIIVDQGSALAGSGNVTASKVIVNGQLGDTTSNGGMTIHGDLDINTTGSYLWNLYANSANASQAGTDFSAPLTVNGTTTLTGNSTFSMYFDPTTVDYLNDFWDFNQSWTVMNGTAISGNLSAAFVANSAPGFSANTFRISNNGTSLLLSYLAPRIDDPTNISPTGVTDLPSYNSEPVKLVIDAPPTGTAVLANSNPSLTSIVLNSGSLISPTNTAIPENANVTVNDGTMGFQGAGVNYINGLLLTGGKLGTGGNTTVAVRSFLVTGGQLAGSGNATYWADNYLFQAVAPAKVDAKLDNLGTVSGFASTALITTPITPGAASAPVVFDTSMLYSGNTTIAGGILQLGSAASGDINLAAGSTITLNNKDGYAGVLNYGSNGNRSIMDNVVTGNGTVGQVGTGTLTITDDGEDAFENFTGNFAAANGKLAFNKVANLGGATGFNLSSNGTLQVDTGVTALSQNLSVTSGTGIVDNNTGATLSLNGTLAKTGSVLVLTGGNFVINGAIMGNSGSFNSDMVYDAATATINVPGVYLGPTFVQGGSTVTSGVANALPTDTVLNVGVATDGAVTNTFDLSTFDQTVAGIASAGSASNIITSSGGNLTVNGAQSTTYNGLITGPLALTRAGTGSTSLGGANTYSGGTTIDAGRIITTSASALGTGAVVLNGGALQVMQTLQISSLNWAGNSAVIALPNAYGTNAYLDVAGVITLGNPSGNTFDLTGTALDGTPTKLLGSGVTALSAASFAATGVNPAYDYELYTQGNDLWLRILSTEIEVSGPNSYTTINVNGAYTMSGVLTVTETGGYTLQYGDQYLFLTATGGITGEYSSIDMPEKFRARLLLGNNNTTAKILVAPDTYTRVAITQNQKNAAKALDSFIPATSGDREAVSLALDLQTAAQYPYAFDQIAPGFYESLANILIEQTYNQAQLLSQRMGSVRLGATGFQAIGMGQPIKYDRDGKSAADAKTASPIVEAPVDTNWNAWVIANGEFSLSQGLSGVPNYNNNAGGFLVGADYRLGENFAAGLFAGYEYSYAKYDGGSSTQGNSALFGLYGTYTHGDGYYADAMVSGGYTGLQTRRSIEFSTIDRTARANPNSGQFSAALNLGKDFEIGKFTLGPIVGAQYTYVGIGGFTESGADSLDLALGQQNANSFRTNLGARLAYNWEVGAKITLIPEVRGFWMHEFLNGPRNISSALDGGNGPSFDYETSAPYNNSVFGGVGVSANFADRWSASVFYNVNFGGDGYTNNIISTTLGLSF